ncbi:MAG TPA: RidA family protein [Candidatus Limnocylindrales bacterium]|nr:RidA family protein [Candidatus Limnocylindrales bacterium]
MKKIYTDKAPRPVGPYSQAIISNGMVFTAGQIGLDPISGNLVGVDIAEQTTQVIKNLNEVLTEAGSSLQKVIKTTCYLKNMDDYTVFNEIYAKHFTNNPARSTVEVSKLPKDALIEIEVIAEI